MAEKRMYQYEAMFLLSPAVAADFGGALNHIREVLARGHAEIIAMRKWFEGRLAYEVDGQKRGVYILVYFSASGADMSHIERDCLLSEKIMRSMILRADHLSMDEMRAYDDIKGLETEAKMRAAGPADQPSAAPAPAPAPAAEPATA